MKVGIRAKFVVYLTATALVPLLAALVAVIVGQRNLRLENVRQTFLAVATSEAKGLENLLIRDVQQFHSLLTRDSIVEDLAGRDEKLSDDELRRRDAIWKEAGTDPETASTHPLIAPALAGQGHAAMNFLVRGNPHFAEAFFTDRHGQLVSASSLTTDFNQADEDWWKASYNGGKGRIVLMPVEPDRSSNTLSIDICLPVLDSEGIVVGVGKGVVDIEQWPGGLKRFVGPVEASILLVNHLGRITFGSLSGTSGEVLDEWDTKYSQSRQPFFRITEGGQIQAFAPIIVERQDLLEDFADLEIQMPWRALILYMSARKAYAEVYSLTMTALVVGLVGILFLFFLGLYLIDRHVLRRLLHIANITRKVREGDLSSRVRPGTPPEGFQPRDEIEELGHGFDRMVEHVERSYEQLAAANELKQNFIRVAGHELRTPISYMTGMAKLLHDNQDSERLSNAIQSMGAKAERLNRIIQSMFKLMPEGVLPSSVNYAAIGIPEFLEEVRQEVRAFLEQRNQSLVLELPEDLPLIQADREKLYDIVENLVMNAIKFTPDGGEVRVSVRAEPDEDRMILSVSDQGEGISGEDLPLLFEPFYSGRDVLKHSTGRSGYRQRGMGLGLAIVNYFARLQGGTVEASSGPGGSTFTVTLPATALPRDE